MNQTEKPLSHAKSLSSRYNGGLDFWKLVFTFVIVIYHGGQIGDGRNIFNIGATAVEFFFILSCYFMAVSAMKKPDPERGTLGKETAGFIWHKIKSILPYYLFGYFISLVLYIYIDLRQVSGLSQIVKKLSLSIPNFFLLSTSGLEETTVLGMTWYISAMLLAMCFLYPLLRKYKDMYMHVILPYYLFGYFISLVLYIYIDLRQVSGLSQIVKKLSLSIPNFFLLSTSGLEETTVLGMTWYISAMLLAMCFLYPLQRKYKDMYLHVIAPLSAILVAGYMCQKFGNFKLTYELDIFVTKEILRAVVGLNIGCTVYVVSEKLKKVPFTTFSRVLLALVEWGCYLWVLLGMHFMEADYVFVELFLYFFAISITTSKQSILGHIFDHNFIKATNRFSLALYLCHSACRRVIRYLEPDWGYYQTIAVFVLFSIVTAVICMVVVALIQKIIRKYAPELKKIWIQSSNNQI